MGTKNVWIGRELVEARTDYSNKLCFGNERLFVYRLRVCEIGDLLGNQRFGLVS